MLHLLSFLIESAGDQGSGSSLPCSTEHKVWGSKGVESAFLRTFLLHPTVRDVLLLHEMVGILP